MNSREEYVGDTQFFELPPAAPQSLAGLCFERAGLLDRHHDAASRSASRCGITIGMALNLRVGIDLAVLEEMAAEPQGASRLSVTRVGEVVAAA